MRTVIYTTPFTHSTFHTDTYNFYRLWSSNTFCAYFFSSTHFSEHLHINFFLLRNFCMALWYLIRYLAYFNIWLLNIQIFDFWRGSLTDDLQFMVHGLRVTVYGRMSNVNCWLLIVRVHFHFFLQDFHSFLFFCAVSLFSFFLVSFSSFSLVLSVSHFTLFSVLMILYSLSLSLFSSPASLSPFLLSSLVSSVLSPHSYSHPHFYSYL